MEHFDNDNVSGLFDDKLRLHSRLLLHQVNQTKAELLASKPRTLKTSSIIDNASIYPGNSPIARRQDELPAP